MTLVYQNFDILITPDEQIYTSSRTEGEAGPARFQIDDNALNLALPLLAQEQADLALARTLGYKLYAALFPAAIHAHLQRSQAAAPDGRLRLRLRIQSPRLAAFPWELLHNGEEFLGTTTATTIVRYPDSSQPIEDAQVRGALRVLVAIASPANYPDLRREEQAAELKKAFNDLQAEGLLEVEFLTNATYTGLIRRLRAGEFHLLHFLGYSAFDPASQQDALVLEEENGQARRVSADDFAELLYREDQGRIRRSHPSLRLVLITDCEQSAGAVRNFSAGVAERLVRRGIPAALALRYSLPDAVARAFAIAFYQNIVRGLCIDEAVAFGRVAVKDSRAPDGAEANPAQWGAPALYMRLEDSQIFEPQQIRNQDFARSSQQVLAELEQFRVETRDPITRLLLNNLWAFTGVCVLGILIYQLTSALDVLFCMGAALALAEVWLLRDLFRRKVPETFDTLWRRRLIVPRGKGNAIEQYLGFLKDYNALLNDERWAWAFRVPALVVVAYTLLMLDYRAVAPALRVPAVVLLCILAPVAGFVLGTLLWKMIATVVATRRLSYRFDLDVRPGHPDKCGGFKPLGDLYFSHAWIMLFTGLFFAAWVLILSLSRANMEQYLFQAAPEQAALLPQYPALCRAARNPGATLPPEFLPSICERLGGTAAQLVNVRPELVLVAAVDAVRKGEPSIVQDWSRYNIRYYRWFDSYRVLLICMAVLAVVTFIVPMYNTRRTMRGKGPDFRRRADSLAGEIADLERYLESYAALDDNETNAVNERLQWLEERYQKYNDPPMWPFDTRVRTRLVGSLTTMAGSLFISTILPSFARDLLPILK